MPLIPLPRPTKAKRQTSGTLSPEYIKREIYSMKTNEKSSIIVAEAPEKVKRTFDFRALAEANRLRQLNANRPKKPAAADATATVADVTTFADLIREFEQAYEAYRLAIWLDPWGHEELHAHYYLKALQSLATAIAYSALGLLADPQRKTAPTREKVSNSGLNPVMLKARRDIYFDMVTLEDSAAAYSAAMGHKYNDAGMRVDYVRDSEASKKADRLLRDTIRGGADYVQEIEAILLEIARDYSTIAPGWMEAPVTILCASKHVLAYGEAPIMVEDFAAPIQLVYRRLRRFVAENASPKADPFSAYIYAECDDPAAALDSVFYRFGRYQDAAPAEADWIEDNAIVSHLKLTDREAVYFNHRLRGEGRAAIARIMGISEKRVDMIAAAVEARARAAGIAPAADDAVNNAPVGVVQIKDGERVAVFASARQASIETGINPGSIRAAASGKRQSAGGYIWEYVDPAAAFDRRHKYISIDNPDPAALVVVSVPTFDPNPAARAPFYVTPFGPPAPPRVLEFWDADTLGFVNTARNMVERATPAAKAARDAHEAATAAMLKAVPAARRRGRARATEEAHAARATEEAHAAKEYAARVQAIADGLDMYI